MARRSRRKRDEDDSEVNLTPMLDVVFIMLIFFIVTASFVKEAGLDVNRPDSVPENQQNESKSILVLINGQDGIEIRRRRVDLRAVTSNIQRLLAENPNASVILRVDKDATNGTFVEVLDQIRLAGAPNVALVQPS